MRHQAKKEMKDSIQESVEPIAFKIEQLLQARARWKSDDLLRQGKIVERFDSIMTDYQDLRDFVEVTMSPLVVCLLETQLMQLSVE